MFKSQHNVLFKPLEPSPANDFRPLITVKISPLPLVMAS